MHIHKQSRNQKKYTFNFQDESFTCKLRPRTFIKLSYYKTAKYLIGSNSSYCNYTLFYLKCVKKKNMFKYILYVHEMHQIKLKEHPIDSQRS
jgi:hypothetical protein